MPTAQSYFFNGRQDYMSTAGYGLQCSRLSTAQRTNISPPLGAGDGGLTVFDVDLKSFCVWSGSTWSILPGGGGTSVVAVANVAALRAMTDVTDGEVINTRGYYTDNDGGQGQYYFSASSALADNGGTVIAPTVGSGRFLLLNTKVYNVRQFGAKGDNATDDIAVLDATVLAANSATPSWYLASIYVPNGNYRVSRTWAITGVLSVRGEGYGYNGQASRIICTDQTVSCTSIARPGSGDMLIERLNFSFVITTTYPNSVNAAGLELVGDFCNSVLRDLGFQSCGTAILHKGTGGTICFSNSFDNIQIYGFGYSGIRLVGYGTQNTFINVNIRNAPANPVEQSASGTISNVGAVVTISNLSTTFTAALRVGQIIVVSGASVSDYNVVATLQTVGATTITYTLNAVPGSAASGTATVSNWTGTSLGEPFYSNADVNWLGGNIEWCAYSGYQIYNGGVGYYAMLHLEGFFATAGTALIYNNAVMQFGLLDIINGTVGNGFACYIMGGNRSVVNQFTCRDLYYSGGSMNWKNSTGFSSSVILQTQATATLRYDRTSNLSAPPGFDWYQIGRAHV